MRLNTELESLENVSQRYLLTSLNNRIFSGAAVAFSQLEKRYTFKRFITYEGFTCESDIKKRISKETLFDLASLTKPLVTVLCTLHLIEDGIIDWQEKLESLVSQKIEKNKKNITLYQLLSHCSGLPAYRPYYKDCEKYNYSKAKETIIKNILDERLEYSPGQKNVYSDLGYILLGHIIEKKRGMGLEKVWEQNIAHTFQLQNKLFFSKNSNLGPTRCAATTVCSKDRQTGFGVVNDDNCRVMGGVAGHAGLFGTLEGVLFLCENLLKQYKKVVPCKPYSHATLTKALTKTTHSTWACGFDTPSPYNSVSGDCFTGKTVGHLGYTGTSFWIDLEKEVIVVVLTNRTHMKTDKEAMNTFRKKIHNKLMNEFSVC